MSIPTPPMTLDDVRLSVEEKRERSRRQIMDASLELFYTKGYQNTTTRDIVAKVGILNGSLYNRFKSKEEILLSIVTDTLNEMITENGDLMMKESNPLVVAVLPGAFEVYMSSRSPKAADLIYEVHRLWATVEKYTDINIEWFSKYFERYGINFADTEGCRLKVLSFLGAIGNICGSYAHGEKEDFDMILRFMISYVSAGLNLPVFEMEKTASRIKEILNNSHVKLYEEKGIVEITEKE